MLLPLVAKYIQHSLVLVVVSIHIIWDRGDLSGLSIQRAWPEPYSITWDPSAPGLNNLRSLGLHFGNGFLDALLGDGHSHPLEAALVSCDAFFGRRLARSHPPIDLIPDVVIQRVQRWLACLLALIDIKH